MTEIHADAPDSIVVALVQMACVEDNEAHVAKALSLIGQAASLGANIVCLQELFGARYPCQSEEHSHFSEAEPIPGPTTDRLQRAAAENNVVIVGSLFERRAPGLYHNSAVVLDADGQLLGMYRKMHIPDDPYYYEKFYFTPGDLGFQCFSTRFGRIGIGVCWDQWFPEAARLLALSGAELLLYPTAIGYLPGEKKKYGESQRSAWETVMRSHAITNGVFVAAANRVGIEGSLEFWGASFACDPYGNVLEKASGDREQLVLVSCQRSVVETARTHWPFLRDRRNDAYQGLTERYLD